MKSILKILLLCTWVIFSQPAFGQIEKGLVPGTWLGTLDLRSASLRLVFNISYTEEDSFEATMDSPDQGAQGIPMGQVSLEGGSLIIEAPMIQGSFAGKFTSPNSIEGEWQQPGGSFVLNDLFQNCETGLPTEYNLIEETFDPAALELMTNWILQL